jgi:hypothetical protein
MNGDYTGLPQTACRFCGMVVLYYVLVCKKSTEFGLLASCLLAVTLIYEELRMNLPAFLLE